MAQILIKRLSYGWNIGHQSEKKDMNSFSKPWNYISDNNLENNLNIFFKAHVKTSCTIIYGMRFWDLEFSMFLTFSLFMNFQTRFHEKACYFYILTVFGDLKLEYIGALFIFPFLLVWSWRYNDNKVYLI